MAVSCCNVRSPAGARRHSAADEVGREKGAVGEVVVVAGGADVQERQLG
jgi:hypothetical protein